VSEDERRRFQRLVLTQPIDGWLGDWPVRLEDVSATGALIDSDEPLPLEARALLRFFWRGGGLRGFSLSFASRRHADALARGGEPAQHPAQRRGNCAERLAHD
jgi:hypothetical protein